MIGHSLTHPVTSMTPNLSPLHTSCMAGRLLDYQQTPYWGPQEPVLRKQITNMKTSQDSSPPPEKLSITMDTWISNIPKGISPWFWTQFPADQGGRCRFIPWWWTLGELDIGCRDSDNGWRWWTNLCCTNTNQYPHNQQAHHQAVLSQSKQQYNP